MEDVVISSNQQVVQWAIWGIIMSLIFSLLTKIRKKDMNIKYDSKLSLPLYVMIIGAVDFALFAAFAFISNIFPNGTESLVTTVLFLCFAFLGIILIYAYYIEKFTYDSTEIRYRKFTGKKVSIKWKDVVAIEYKASMQWIKIRDDKGGCGYFSTMLKGLRQFSEMILDNVNHKNIDAKTLAILDRIKRGEIV
jgi:hypothetical protein